MTKSNKNLTDPSSVRTAFKQLMAHIRIAQLVEKIKIEVELETGDEADSVADVAATAWDYAFDSCKDLIEAQPTTSDSQRYLIVTGYINDMFMTEAAYRDQLAARAAEQRAEMSIADEEIEPDMRAALQLLTFPIGVPEDYADQPWPGCTP